MRVKLAATIRLGVLAALTPILGCANAYFGIRPPAVPFHAKECACARYERVFNYTEQLQEAYHSRATQNRWWVYVAGTLALGTTAASGGLGAAGAAGLSIALLSISGGFTSGFFALLNNDELADIYTISANQLATGLKEAGEEIHYAEQPTERSCEKALDVLTASNWKAETELERARTDKAAAAALRTEAEVARLRGITDQFDDQSLGRKLQSARISKADWVGGTENAELLVVGGDLSTVAIDRLQVKVDTDAVRAGGITQDSEGQYHVIFKPPSAPTDAPAEGRSVLLLVPSAGITVPAAPRVTLRPPTPKPPNDVAGADTQTGATNGAAKPTTGAPDNATKE